MSTEKNTPIAPELLDEFEMLMALRLCKELDPSGEARLKALTSAHQEFAERYKNYIGMQRLMDQVPAGSLEDVGGGRVVTADFSAGAKRDSNSKSGTSGGASAGSRSSRRLWIGAAMAATALIAVGTAFVVQSLRKPFSRTLAFPHGKCSSGGKELRSGAGVGDDLESGSGSICDAQINEGGRVAVRIFPDSKISFDSRSDALHITLEKGRILLDAEKRSGQGLRIDSPGATVAILGTKISVSRPDDTRMTVDLLEGKAEVRSGPALHSRFVQKDVSDEELSRAAADVPELYQVQSIVLEAGSTAEVQTPRLPQGAAAAFLSDLDRRGAAAAADPEKRGSTVNALLVVSGRQAVAAQPQMKMELEQARPVMKQEPMSEPRKSEFDKWSEGMKGPGPSVETKTTEKDAKPDRADSQKPSGPAGPGGKPAGGQPVVSGGPAGKPAGGADLPRYRIRLKDGRVLLGRAEQEGDNYRVSTDSGDVVVPQSQVETIDIQR